MDAGRRAMNMVFDPMQKRIIPFFQRSYVWEEGDWERLLDDVEMVSSEAKPYFMGVVALKQINTTSDMAAQRMVIDGQQRMTTLNIFFRVACELQNKLDKFGQWFETYEGEPQIVHNHIDKKIFEAIVSGKLNDALRTEYKGSRVLECYDWFTSKEAELKKIDLMRVFSNLFFVGMDLDGSDDEQKIFDTINSLGVNLTTAELLKNELYRQEDLGLYEETWLPTFEPINDLERIEYWNTNVSTGRNARTSIDLFLQSYIILKNDDVDSSFRVEDLFNNYRNWLRKTGTTDDAAKKREFSNSLCRSADIFRENFQVDIKDKPIDGKDFKSRLVLLSSAQNIRTIVPYFLYIIENVQDPVEQKKLFQTLESYLVRRIIYGSSTKNYNQIFANFVKQKVQTADALWEKINGFDNISDRIPKDAELKEAISGYWQYNNSARTVLYLLEKSLETNSSSATVLPLSSYHLEHLMPKNWRKNWGSLDDGAAEIRDRKLLTFGNLSLLRSTLNTTIKDSAWDEKKSGKNNDGLVAYASGLLTLQPFLDSEVWNEEEIEARAAWLYDQAIKVWSI